MKPFDDSISEEITSPYQNMTTLLQGVMPQASITAEEQSQILARVRTRLRETDDVSPGDELSIPKDADGVFPPLPVKRKSPRRFSRMRYTLNMIAAVLVIGVIAGVSLFLFSPRNHNSDISTAAPVGPVKSPLTVRSEAGGLEASLQITSGPYFLSELLDATVTLTNHSNKSVFLGGSPAALNFCNGALSLTTTGGIGPHYDFKVDDVFVSCPFGQTKLDPGKTLIAHGYIPLTSSGRVILTTSALFLTVTKDRYGEEGTSPGHSPLDGHWPTLHINVAARIPADRTLSLQQHGPQVVVDAPASVRSHLVSYDTVTCVQNMSTSAGWYPLTTPILHERGCPGANKHWTYAVGVPGYAIASGEISS